MCKYIHIYTYHPPLNVLTQADSEAVASSPTTDTSSSDSGSDTGVIVGAVLGTLAALALVGVAVVYFVRRKKRNAKVWVSVRYVHE